MMATDTRPSAQDLCKLIDSLIAASDLAGEGNVQAVETSLQCFNSLKQLQVDTQLLVETQAGKKLRRLTKHQDLNIKGNAAELLNVWKSIVSSEAAAVEKAKEEVGGLQPEDSTAASGKSTQSCEPAVKRQKLSPVDPPGAKSNGSASPLATKPVITPVQKSLNIPQTSDASRNKIRTQLAEAINLASADVPEADAGSRAAEVESAVLSAYGAINPKYKAKIRSIWVNLKDAKNPDFRQAVLSGEISAEETVTLKPEEMASRVRQAENQKIREAALFESQRGRKSMATTDQFQCGKCKKRQTSYYQMQTRSADEPMTTFVICQVCDNRWKFC